jgi:glycosyltransferase involved in cell wall biosynthesis
MEIDPNGAGNAQRRSHEPEKLRVLFVGHAATPSATTRRKWDALSKFLDIHVIVESDNSSAREDDRVIALKPARPQLVRGIAFYSRLPNAIRRELSGFRPHAVIAQGPYDALPAVVGQWLAKGKSVPLIVEVHGDWRAATRLYGSPLRRLLSPLADAIAVWSLRRATAIRAIGPAMSKIAKEATGRDPVAVFPTFFDAETYFSTPPVRFPPTPTVLWVGALQHSKNPWLLASAWRIVANAVPQARLVVVGSGPLQAVIDELQSEYPERICFHSWLEPQELKVEFDSATALVLPSRSEGLGRVVVESFARGRPVIGAEVGGIPDLVKHEVNGLLIPSDDVSALASAMTRLLNDQVLAARLGDQARADAETQRWTADRYARAVFSLVQDSLAVSRRGD